MTTSFKGLALPAAAACLALSAFLFGGTLTRVDERVAGLESFARRKAERVNELEAELATVHGNLREILIAIESGADRGAETVALVDRLQQTEARLHDLDAQVAHFDALKAGFNPNVLEARLEKNEANLTQKWEHLQALAQQALENAERGLDQIEQIDRRLETDPSGLWRDLVGPVVQLAGDSSVGSGVLLASRPDPEDDEAYQTHLLTAWHVVRDIQGSLDNKTMPVPVAIYAPDGGITNTHAHLIDFDPDIDVALLLLDSIEAVEFGTRCAPRERVQSVRIFEPIIAVGCPLGNDPIPTRGEIASNAHRVDGTEYWMINAPTYIGNSGGAIYDARTHELLGIFSKIYTHGSLRPTVVPHMGLVTPLVAIYDWMETIGYESLVPSAANPSAKVAAASPPTPSTTPASAPLAKR